jgi:hypothetical protein
MIAQLLDKYADCISFRGIRTRYDVFTNSFSVVGSIIFWIDYKKPALFSLFSTGELGQKAFVIKCEYEEVNLADIADKDILLVIGNTRISKILLFKVCDKEDNIYAILFEISEPDSVEKHKVLVYQNVYDDSPVIRLSLDDLFIIQYLKDIEGFTNCLEFVREAKS